MRAELIIYLIWCCVLLHQELQAQTKGDYYNMKRLGMSPHFEVETHIWCRGLDENMMPVDTVTSFNAYERVMLWINLKGDSESYGIIKDRRLQPAFVKFFRSANYGMSLEKLTSESNTIQRAEQSKQNLARIYSVMEEDLVKKGYFNIAVWTESFLFHRHGTYFIKIVDFENNTIGFNGKPLIKIDVQSK